MNSGSGMVGDRSTETVQTEVTYIRASEVT
jgi:hypothetical protein